MQIKLKLLLKKITGLKTDNGCGIPVDIQEKMGRPAV